MKDSLEKIRQLADELAKNADVTNGGGIIILACDPPNAEKGTVNSVVFMKGTMLDLITTFSTSLVGHENLKEITQHALFMSSLIPGSFIKKKEE